MIRMLSLTLLPAFVGLGMITLAVSQEATEATAMKPTAKFFFFDARETEWAVSAEPNRMQQHFNRVPESSLLFDSLNVALSVPADSQKVRATMSKWIEAERDRFGNTGSRSEQRIRVAEGVTAYMRAHDFDAGQLIAALLRRSGATDVEVAAVHLVDRNGKSTYKLKVMLPGNEIAMERQGVDVLLNSPNVSHDGVVYALALALFETHEIIEAQSTGEPMPDTDAEQLPIPEPEAAPQPIGPALQPVDDEPRSVLIRSSETN